MKKQEENEGKKIVAVVILFVCLIGFAAADVYMYFSAGAATKLRPYTEKKSNVKMAQDDSDDYYEEDYDTVDYTGEMSGFSVGTATTVDNSDDTKTEKQEDSKNFILPDSDKKEYSMDEIKKLSKKENQLAINEIYARHGYIFSKNLEMKTYFESKSWYVGTVTDQDDISMNKYEKANKDKLVDYAIKKGWREK